MSVQPHRALRAVVALARQRLQALDMVRERFDEFAHRFATRAGKVSSAAGFESFELLRPSDDRDVYLVYTRWESQDAFDAWVAIDGMNDPIRTTGPAGPTSSAWTTTSSIPAGTPCRSCRCRTGCARRSASTSPC